MTSSFAPTHRLFKAEYRRTLEWTLAVGLALHLLAALVVPPIAISPYRLPGAPPIAVIDLPPEILVPPRPPEMARPELPDEIFMSVTAPAFDFRPNVLDPMNPPATVGAAAAEEPFVAVDREPAVIKRVSPQYPSIAREAGAEGTVLVEVVVGIDGRVTSARVLTSNTVRALEEEALRAALQWLFTPGMQRDRPVPARLLLPFEFRLR